jgi:hypothetical protein
MNQTIFFTHLMPRVYPHPVSMTLFSFFIKYYGVFLMLFIVWHLTRTMALFETIDNRISSCEVEIQNLKRKRDDRDEMMEFGEFMPKRQRVFRRYPRTAFKFESFGDSVKKDDTVKEDAEDEVKADESVS